MKKILTIMTATMLSSVAAAQETYSNASLAQKDLNGTARYVGMGGAMEALGADISTISTNPAGIGLFRRNVMNISFGMNSQSDARNIGKDKTNASFDQAGFVYTMKIDRNSNVNFGVNYTKSRNFNQILAATGRLNGASQNKLTSMKNYNDKFRLGRDGNRLTSDWGKGTDYSYSQIDYLYANGLLADRNGQLVKMDQNGGYYIGNADGTFDANGVVAPAFYNATGYDFGRGASGYIGEYDFNLSGNVNDRFYWGFSFGLYDVHYRDVSAYSEDLVNGSNQSIGSVTIADERKTTGTGFDVKMGVIIRPVEESPFRIGLYVHTPTWYDLKTTNRTALINDLASGYGNNVGTVGERYNYKFYTPWRFGASLGYTVGNKVAIGATYEYADYQGCDIRVNDGVTYDYWGNAYNESYSDEVMKDNIKSVLKGVSTLKVGVEYKPIANVALRLGYNYVSPMYNMKGYKDCTQQSYSVYYSSTTDYTNWKATNRVTAGVGYNYKNFSFDVAYQYSCTDGEFSPFMPSTNKKIKYYDNVADITKVSDKHHQLLFSLGYKF